MNSKVRKTECTPTCISGDGNQLCCKVGQVRYRKRWYTCSDDSSEQYTQLQGTDRHVSVELLARQEKTCVCYKCSDVICSTEQPPLATAETICDTDKSNTDEDDNDSNNSQDNNFSEKND